MKTMNIPGFRAEESLYRTRGQYRNAGGFVAAETNILPQLKIVATGAGSAGAKMYCPAVGDLANDAYQNSIDPSNSAEEQKAWRETANQIIGAGRSRMGCSFGVE